MRANLVNLTGQDIKVLPTKWDEEWLMIDRSGRVAWIARQLGHQQYEIVGLPDEEKDTLYIVEPDVFRAAQASGRADVMMVDKSDCGINNKTEVRCYGFIR